MLVGIISVTGLLIEETGAGGGAFAPGAVAAPPPKKKEMDLFEQIKCMHVCKEFSGEYRVKFGHFVTFFIHVGYVFSDKKVLPQS